MVRFGQGNGILRMQCQKIIQKPGGKKIPRQENKKLKLPDSRKNPVSDFVFIVGIAIQSLFQNIFLI